MAERTPTYAALLREAIQAAASSRRRLSGELAATTGNEQDSEYRALGKYLAGDETPNPERAAILAVLLEEPRLALVSEVAARRRDRLAELESTVDALRPLLRVGDLQEQLDDLARRVGHLERQARPGSERGSSA